MEFNMFGGVYARWPRILARFLMVERVCRRLKQEVPVIRGTYLHTRKTGVRNNAKHRLAVEKFGHCVQTSDHDVCADFNEQVSGISHIFDNETC